MYFLQKEKKEMNKAFEALFYHYVRELGKKGEYNVSLDL